jgi:class 3 adenylate cyclase
MRRKLTVIMAADVAGYSRLMSEDEEETGRRLAQYTAVFQQFINDAEGRIFNTAGDAILAEFPSSVNCLRAAVDIQETLRTRNRTYSESRQMLFRIGITVGDVMEKDGDLIGEAVNIAARLEGLAEAGGICVSRAVYEQVAGKLSIPFVDLGPQQVKNIREPVHAFQIGGQGEAERVQAHQAAKVAVPATRPARRLLWPAALAGLALAIGVAVLALGWPRTAMLTGMGAIPAAGTQTDGKVAARKDATPNAPVQVASVLPEATKAPPPEGNKPEPRALIYGPKPGNAPLTMTLKGKPFDPNAVPVLCDECRMKAKIEYAVGLDHRAFVLAENGIAGWAYGRATQEEAISVATEGCTRQTKRLNCALYSVNGIVVWEGTVPPVPPLPWVAEAPVKTPFDAEMIGGVSSSVISNLRRYAEGASPKALSMGPNGHYSFFTRGANTAEVIRRSLEYCGTLAKVACRVIAVDNNFVVAPEVRQTP